MCLAMPPWVTSGGMPEPVAGDYVLVHAGQMLDRTSADEAEQIPALYASLM